MGEVFEMIAALSLLAVPVAMVVGLIRPAWLRLPNRGMVMLFAGSAFLFAAMAVSFLADQDSKGLPIQAVAETPDRQNVPEFAFDLDGLVTRYNQALHTLDSDIRVSPEKENDNGKFITSRLTSNSNIALIVTANNKTRAVQSIIMMGVGEGTTQSGLNIIFSAYAVVMMIEDPLMLKSQRATIGFLGSDFSKNDDVKIKRHGVSYHLTYSEAIGTMLIAEPIK